MNRLDALKSLIQANEAKITLSLRTTLEQAGQSGCWLLEAKRLVRHGEWEGWLRALGKPSPRTCRRYMQIHKEPDKARQCNNLESFSRFYRKVGKDVGKQERSEAIAKARNLVFPLATHHQIHHIDNRKFRWPMVNHIWTDPRWNHFEDYQWLAEFANNNLLPGGLLAVQCGQVDLAKIIPVFHRLNYVATLSIVYTESNNFNWWFVNNWKPVLLFSNGKARRPSKPVSDVFTASFDPSDIRFHEWQQPLAPFLHWIPALSEPGELIADPFACTSTIGVACKLTARKFVGTEINGDMVAIARMRLGECA